MEAGEISGRDRGLLGIRKLKTEKLGELHAKKRRLLLRVFR